MSKGKLFYLEGNVCEPQRDNKSEIVVIPHCCNNEGVMGAGVALALRKKWPGVYQAYTEGEMIMGSVSYYVNREEKIVVANMIGQNGTCDYPHNIKPIRYCAIVKAMSNILKMVTNIQERIPDSDIVIHTPKFGSDLAGGTWEFILELIEEIWVNNGMTVKVYQFQPEK